MINVCSAHHTEIAFTTSCCPICGLRDEHELLADINSDLQSENKQLLAELDELELENDKLKEALEVANNKSAQ